MKDKKTIITATILAIVLVLALIAAVLAFAIRSAKDKIGKDKEEITKETSQITETETEEESETETEEESETETETETETTTETVTTTTTTAQSTSAVSAGYAGSLSVSGTKLVGESGSIVTLRGVSTHGLAWYPSYVNEAAFKTLRDDYGINLIRLAMYTMEYGGYCNGGDKSALKALIDTGVKACANLNMYCIIDWHILSDSNPNTNINEAKTFFAEMAEKYASYDNVLYEICNEPNGGTSWSDIKSYADTIIPIIRQYDSDAIIIVGTPTWSQDVDAVISNPVANSYNVMYAVHFYAATHTDYNRQKVVTALNAGIPVFFSEFSICDASGNGSVDYTSASAWFDLIDQYDIPYAAWNLSNKNESSALINSSCSKTSGWTYDELSVTGQWILTQSN